MEFHRVDPSRELEALREFLSESDPDDYLLTDLAEWTRDGRLWAGREGDRWLAFGRLHDLGDREGWVSGFRVAAQHRGHGLGGQLLDRILTDARSIGLTSLRATIELENVASDRLFMRFGFRPVLEVALRCGRAEGGRAPELHRVEPGVPWSGTVGWIPGTTGYVDVLPGEDGGRFGRWRPSLVERWKREGKLYAGRELAVAAQVDWWSDPRTLWVNPLEGSPERLIPAVGSLARALGHEEWQAFLPSTDDARREYDRLGLFPHAAWGARLRIFERNESGTEPVRIPG